MSADAYLGIGANLGNPLVTFDKALNLISSFGSIQKLSKIYKSAPFGYSNQPPFTNAAVHLKTNFSPLELLSQMKDVESQLGKKVIHKNGPRIIDLDLLLYDKLVLKTEELTLPHPGILIRDFVLLPMIDLDSSLTHPAWGSKTLKSALSGLQKKFVENEPDLWNYPD